jgi:hypothetical protein
MEDHTMTYDAWKLRSPEDERVSMSKAVPPEYCFNCGEELCFYTDADYDPLDICGRPECVSARRDAIKEDARALLNKLSVAQLCVLAHHYGVCLAAGSVTGALCSDWTCMNKADLLEEIIEPFIENPVDPRDA